MGLQEARRQLGARKEDRDAVHLCNSNADVWKSVVKTTRGHLGRSDLPQDAEQTRAGASQLWQHLICAIFLWSQPALLNNLNIRYVRKPAQFALSRFGTTTKLRVWSVDHFKCFNIITSRETLVPGSPPATD